MPYPSPADEERGGCAGLALAAFLAAYILAVIAGGLLGWPVL